MIVITMTSCPPKLRGDLSKWLCEINTGVYVGQVNARVREALWLRVCENISDGQASMVYSSLNEQRMEFRTHNSTWKTADYDGIKLMKRPLSGKQEDNETEELQKGFSKAARHRIAGRRKTKNIDTIEEYVFLDLETTGLDFKKDEIIEIGVMYIDSSGTESKWGTLIKMNDKKIPDHIVNLTGITDEILNQDGIKREEAYKKLSEIINGKTVVCFNMKFDISFLQESYKRIGMQFNIGRIVDVLPLARKYINKIENYKLGTLADYFGIAYNKQHRAVEDCWILYQVFLKLNEF